MQTLQYLRKQGCRIIILSHLGRPEGKPDPAFSLRPVGARIAELIGIEPHFVTDFDQVDSDAHELTLVENIRFWPGEEDNDNHFAARIAELADVFVQDGFGVVHRAHATTDAITRHLLSVGGILLDKEVSTITDAMESPKHPFVVIMGGAKISDKIKVIERFIKKADKILIGGAMANTFLAYENKPIGKSLYEEDQEETIATLAQKALAGQHDRAACKETMDSDSDRACLQCVDLFELPTDVAVAKSVDASEHRVVVEAEEVGDDEYILDIGPKTIDRYQEILRGAQTVIWNGPVGYTEIEQFAHGSNHLAETLKQEKAHIKSIIGGGDTAGFILQWDADKGASFYHISTGGGAALDLMAGKELPGVTPLNG